MQSIGFALLQCAIRWCSSKVFCWEPEGHNRCTKSMALTPFWLSANELYIHLSVQGHCWKNWVYKFILNFQFRIFWNIPKYKYNIEFPWGYKEILSHRVPIFPCILRRQDIQYYYHYLDHPYELMNSLSEPKKSLKMMTLGISFQRFWSNTNLNHSQQLFWKPNEVTIEYAW